MCQCRVSFLPKTPSPSDPKYLGSELSEDLQPVAKLTFTVVETPDLTYYAAASRFEMQRQACDEALCHLLIAIGTGRIVEHKNRNQCFLGHIIFPVLSPMGVSIGKTGQRPQNSRRDDQDQEQFSGFHASRPLILLPVPPVITFSLRPEIRRRVGWVGEVLHENHFLSISYLFLETSCFGVCTSSEYHPDFGFRLHPRIFPYNPKEDGFTALHASLIGHQIFG